MKFTRFRSSSLLQTQASLDYKFLVSFTTKVNYMEPDALYNNVRIRIFHVPFLHHDTLGERHFIMLGKQVLHLPGVLRNIYLNRREPLTFPLLETDSNADAFRS